MIKKGDFILIIDPRESDRYLKIGEVIKIQTDNNDNIEEYTVRFGSNYDTGSDDLDWYGADLLEICKILQFK